MHAIYSITFLGSTGRQYIGSAVDFRTRKLKHTGDLRRGKHCNIHLSRAFKKYGESVMSITVIEEVADKGDLIQREQCHIDMHDFKMLYNLSPTAGSMLGYKHTEETRAKLSKRVLSEERKTQIGLQHKGKIIPEAMRVKIRDFQTGRKKSAETIKKLTAARRKSCGKIVLRVCAETLAVLDEYECNIDAARAFGLSSGNMWSHLNKPFQLRLGGGQRGYIWALPSELPSSYTTEEGRAICVEAKKEAKRHRSRASSKAGKAMWLKRRAVST